MRSFGKIISYSTNEGKKWAFVIVAEDNIDLYDKHTNDEKLQIVKKTEGLRVQFTDVATQEKTILGKIVTTQDTKFTDEEIAEICKEHGLINAVEGLHPPKADLAQSVNKVDNGTPDPA